MGRIVLSKEEQSELESSNVLIKPHEAAVRPGYGIYHNPATGKEITHPIDPYHMDFFSSVDAPPESETKHVVSQASQPETVGQERLL
jgi:hypothetical protein